MSSSIIFVGMIAKQHPEFITVTGLNWKPVLSSIEHKENSLRFLVKEGKVRVSCFVLMDNHFHLIWQVMGDHKKEAVQRDFLRFTAQQILKNLRNTNSPLLDELLVEAKDRKYQVWERNSLSIELRSSNVYRQKLEYIHANPVRAGLCALPEDYQYSSAGLRLRIGVGLLVKNTNNGGSKNLPSGVSGREGQSERRDSA